MNRHPLSRLLLAMLAFGLLPAMAAAADAARLGSGDDEGTPTLRFALVAGANDGGADRVRLRYAHSDAEAVAEVLEELGGIGPGERVLLLDPDAEALTRAFGELATVVDDARAAGRRTELVFYYSGHSDEQGLLLSGERLSYESLRRQLDAVGTDVRIAILDSCASGALTRGKGGVRRPPFLVDAATRVQGHAFLTSASADEAAQESEALRGSFFTHYLVSGLRGAADATPDGRITLNEAYQYAFAETLARTESTRVGPQHPNYDINLAGRGELVLTDLRETSASLALGEEVEGRLFVRDLDGRLVAEVNKLPGRPMRLGLQPGEYQVGFETRDGMHRGTLLLSEGEVTDFSAARLDALALEDTVTRGADPTRPLTHVPASVSVWMGVGTNTGFPGRVDNAFRFNFAVGRGDALHGFELSLLGGTLRAPSAGLQIAGLFNLTHDFDGAQIGPVFNLAGDVHGAQIGGLLNRSGELTGLQIASANLAGDARGWQIGGLFNHSGRMDGIQIASANLADDVIGAQVGGLFNRAAALRGLQISTVNLAGPMDGAQLGVVNVAKKSRGLMLGVVNVADSLDGLPIGLVNVIDDGLFEVGAYATEHSAANLVLKSGSKHAYTVIGMGLHAYASEPVLRSIAGVGLHFGDRLWVDTDATLTSSSVNDAGGLWAASGLDMVTSLRVAVGYEVVGPFSIYAGPTLNMLISRVREAPVKELVLWSKTTEDLNLAIWPGLAVGLQI